MQYKSVKTFRVAQKVALRNGKDEVLIGRFSSNERTKKPLRGKWDFPGGGLQPTEKLERGLQRELQEELGKMRVQIGELLTVWDWIQAGDSKTRTVCLLYAGKYLGGKVTLNEEHDAYRWVKPKDLRNYDWMMPDLKAVKKVLEVFDGSS